MTTYMLKCMERNLIGIFKVICHSVMHLHSLPLWGNLPHPTCSTLGWQSITDYHERTRAELSKEELTKTLLVRYKTHMKHS